MVLVDSNGIAWFVATGQQGVIEQSRDESADDRWSGNVTGVGRGYETTMIARSHGTNSSSHFASKLFGGNHSGSGASSQRWYDLGIRVDGEVQLQWEGPHPNNHSFTLPASKQPISNIGVGLEGNWIGLKWVVYKIIEGGSPANGGVRCIMWVNTSIAADGKPNNANWRLCLDFIDGVDVEVIDPQDYEAPDECDLEIRRSDTDEHDIYAGGHHWRKLSAADITAFNNGGTTNPPPPPPPPNQPGNIDQFGNKMIYPTKEDGQVWFQTNDPESDGQLISDAEIISRIGDYFVASPEPDGDVFLRLLTTMGDPFVECDVNYSQLASQGHTFTEDDWKNIEMTIFIYPQEIDSSAPDNAVFTLLARSSTDTGDLTCCSDYRYGLSVYLSSGGTLAGQVGFTKRLNEVGDPVIHRIGQSLKTNFYRSWTGFKFIVYNIKGPNNEDWVQLEVWVCPTDSATDKLQNWTKVHSFIDKGNNWGSGGDACGGMPGQALTWGTGELFLRYLNEPEIRWKNWSVREIDINGQFPTDPTDPPTDPPCEEEEPPTTPPPPATASLNRFISWGDNDTTTDATDVLDRIFLETNVAQYLFAGDGPYSTDASDWIDMMSEYFNTTDLKNKLMLAQGNHEHPESESQTAENQIEAWFPGLNNTNDSLDWLQAKKVGNAYVIVMNSQDENLTDIGGDQYNFVQTELTKAKNMRAAGQIDWIITMVHKSWFNLLGSNPAYVQARHTYAAMFNDAQVDFMFHGHNHSYAIWRPIVAIAGDNENTSAQQLFTMASDSTTYDLSKPHGAFYIINGNGGHEINSWGEDPADFPNVIYANDTDFGYTVLDIQGKQAKITAKDASGAVLFTVNATRGTDTAGNPLPPGDDDDEPCTPPPTNPPPPPESIYNDLVIVYNINSDSDGCICNDPGFTPPEPCPEGQHRNASGTCVDDDEEEPPDPDPPGSTTAIYSVRHDGSSPKDYKLGDDDSTSFYKKFGTEILGNDAPLYGVDIKRIEWPMRKSGNPTGNATIVIRKGSDNSIAKTLGTINVQDLTTSFEYKPVENTGSSYTTVVGDRIMIEYTGGDDNDYIIVRTTAEQQNDLKTVHQKVTQGDNTYSNTDTEACFIAYA